MRVDLRVKHDIEARKAAIGLFEVPDNPPQRHAVMREDRVLLAGPVLAAKEHRLMKAGELVNDILEFHMAPIEK